MKQNNLNPTDHTVEQNANSVLRVALGADHGGYHLKEAAKLYCERAGIEYIDYGCESTESVDYPVYADLVCKAIQSGSCDLGILFCGTGIGMSMAANKHKGIRAACCTDEYCTRMTRMHNNSNILCLGGRVVGEGVALELIDIFLHTPFAGERHQRRIDMFMDAE